MRDGWQQMDKYYAEHESGLLRIAKAFEGDRSDYTVYFRKQPGRWIRPIPGAFLSAETAMIKAEQYLEDHNGERFL